MTDIVERLRDRVMPVRNEEMDTLSWVPDVDCKDAADEIVATRAERQRAQEACEQIAKRKDAEIERLRAALDWKNKMIQAAIQELNEGDSGYVVKTKSWLAEALVSPQNP